MMPDEMEQPSVEKIAPVDVHNGDEEGRAKLLEVKDDVGQKPYRKRKRHHFNAIREQLEFYFGDANLSKDRYLKKLINLDPYVPLEEFLKFNKIKTLTSSTEEIATALTNSQLLELDEAHQKVRRKTPIAENRNADERTLYVESLPPTVDHDWVKKIFTRFGTVAYVSLPRYKRSRKIKEFGFVEFEKEESVARAIKAFNEFQGVLNMDETNPEELVSVQSFCKEQENAAEPTEVAAKEVAKESRKRTAEDDASGDEGREIKKVKISVVDDISEGTDSDSGSGSDGSLDGECLEQDVNVERTGNADAPAHVETSSKKKRRKRKRMSKKVKERRRRTLEESEDAAICELKILPQPMWKRLRNRYLNLQREVAALKRRACRSAQQRQSKENVSDCSETAASAAPASVSAVQNDGRLHNMNMNFYGAGDADSNEGVGKSCTDKEGKQAIASDVALSFGPGLIVAVTLAESCVDIKAFKAAVRQNESVDYVDIVEGAKQAYIRLASNEAADDFARTFNFAESKCKVLTGEAEIDYFKKIEHDRDVKRSKQVKLPRNRGRNRVKQTLAKHTRFTDDDEE